MDECLHSSSSPADETFDRTKALSGILTDLMAHAMNLSRISEDVSDPTELTDFLDYAARLMYILRTMFAYQCSAQSIDTQHFLRCQSIIDILHTTEFIVRYLLQNHRTDQTVLVNTFGNLGELFSSMDHRQASSYSTISRSLFSLLQNLNATPMSSS